MQKQRRPLERGGYSEAEGFSGLPQQEAGGEGIDGQVIRVVASRGVGKHGTSDRNWGSRRAIQPQGIIGPVDAERRIDDGQKHLKLKTGGHSRSPVRRTQNLQLLLRNGTQEAPRSTARSSGGRGGWVLHGTSELLADYAVVLLRRIL